MDVKINLYYNNVPENCDVLFLKLTNINIINKIIKNSKQQKKMHTR